MKKLVITTLLTSMSVSLCACGVSKSPIESKTDEIFSAIKSDDKDYLSKLYSDAENRERITVNQETYLTYDEWIEDSDSDIYGSYGPLYLDNFSYKITEVDSEKATVTVDVSYLDGHDWFDEVITSDFFDLIGEESDLSDKLKDVDTSKINEETITLEYEYINDEYKITGITDEFFNLMTYGIYDPLLDFMFDMK